MICKLAPFPAQVCRGNGGAYFCVTLQLYQAPLFMEISMQEYWSGFPCPPPGDLSDLCIEPRSPVLKVDSLLLSTREACV